MALDTFAVYFVCLTSGLVTALELGFCPTNLPTQASFDSTRYSSVKWYEIARIETPLQYGLKCTTARHYKKQDGSLMLLVEGFRPLYVWFGTVVHNYIHGDATTTGVPGKLNVKFTFGIPIVEHFLPNGNYWVLETDYDNYSVVYSCVGFLFIRTQLLWIFSRTTTMNQAVYDQRIANARKLGISVDGLMKSDQSCTV